MRWSMSTRKAFSGSALAGMGAAAALLLAGCAETSSSTTAVKTETVYKTMDSAPSSAPASKSSSKQPSAQGDCTAPVIALDAGHNPVETAQFDPATGVAMRDYPNGAEDADSMAVSEQVQKALTKDGYTVVMVKKSVDDDVTYRERVTRAEQAGADIGVSIHTYTDDHRVFVQRTGLFREGPGPDGEQKRVEYTNAATAKKSQKYGAAIAKARTAVEGREVTVADNSFDGRAPLWSGNIPMIMLISEKVPWVYNEFGVPGGGGSAPIGDDGVATYADGVADGIKAALPNACRPK